MLDVNIRLVPCTNTTGAEALIKPVSSSSCRPAGQSSSSRASFSSSSSSQQLEPVIATTNSDTPSEPSAACAEFATSDELANVAAFEQALRVDLVKRKITTAVLELYCHEEAPLQAIVERMRAQPDVLAWQALRGAPLTTRERVWQEGWARVCNVAWHGLTKCSNESLDHAGDTGPFVVNRNGLVRLSCEQGKVAAMHNRPDVLVFIPALPGNVDRAVLRPHKGDADSTLPPHEVFFSELISCGEVKKAGAVNEPLLQFCRHILALQRDNAITSVCHGFTLIGPMLRVYRFDSQSYSVSEPMDVTDPDQLGSLIMFVSFITCRKSLVSYSPASEFDMVDLAGNVQRWRWREDSRPLEIRLAIFGRRTCCWGGTADRITADEDGAESRNMIVKGSWQLEELVSHEAEMLERLNAAHVEGVPMLLGRLRTPEAMNVAQAFSDGFKLSRSSSGASVKKRVLATLVTSSPIGSHLGKNATLAEIIETFRDAGKTLLSIGQAGIVYRDVNLGNILRVSQASTPTALVIDFDHARLRNAARVVKVPAQHHRSNAHSWLQLVAVERADFRSGNEHFASLSAAQAKELTRGLQNRLRLLLQREQGLAAASTPARKEKLQRSIDVGWCEIEDEYKQVENLRLCPFDDLVSLWFLCLYVLGRASPSRFIWSTLKEETTKNKILTKVDFLEGDWLQLLGFGEVSKEVLIDLLQDIFSILAKREQAVKGRTGALTEGEMVAFSKWDAAFERALVALKSAEPAVEAREPERKSTRIAARLFGNQE